MLYKTNLYGISEVGQNNNGDTITISLPLISDNGQFKLELKKITHNNKKLGYIQIVNNYNGEVYWISIDYNRPNFVESPDLGDNFVLRLQEDGNLTISSETDATKGCFFSSWTSHYETHMAWNGGIAKKPYKIKLTDKGILEIKNKDDVVIWKTTYMWETFSTPFSIDILKQGETTTKTDISPLSRLVKNDGVSGPLDNSIIKQYYDKKFKNTNLPVDFSPFKIVPFNFLRDIGKISSHVSDGEELRNTMIVDKGNGYDAILDMTKSMNFQGDETYLPLGDPFFRIKRTGNISLDLVLMEMSQVFFSFVLLVKNQDKYCNKETKSKYKWVSDNYKCKFGNPNFFNLWYPSDMSYFLPNDIKTGSNYSIGAVTGYEHKGDNNGSIKRPGNPTGDIFIAASVNAKYLVEYENMNPKSNDSEWFLGEYHTQGSDNYCENDFKFWCTSPWGTWALASSATDWYSESTFNRFFDFIPEEAALDMALGNFIPTIADQNITLSKENVYGIAIDLCINNKKLNSQSCIDFYRSLRNSSETFDYSRLITDYCASNDLYKTGAYKKICACHSPTKVYQDYIDEILDGLTDTQRTQVESVVTQPAPCFYPQCALESIEVIPRWNFKRGENCNDNAIHICLNNVDIVNEGEITGNVSADSIIDCVQQNIKETPTDTTDTTTDTTTDATTNTKKSSDTLLMVLGVGFIVLVILYFTMFKR